MNKKTIQASDALAQEYTAFEASMKKVTSEHEEGDVLYAVVTEACGTLDRESNEIKYLREATEVIERWQQQLQGGQQVSKAPSEHGEVILIEQQWRNTVVSSASVDEKLMGGHLP